MICWSNVFSYKYYQSKGANHFYSTHDLYIGKYPSTDLIFQYMHEIKASEKCMHKEKSNRELDIRELKHWRPRRKGPDGQLVQNELPF